MPDSLRHTRPGLSRLPGASVFWPPLVVVVVAVAVAIAAIAAALTRFFEFVTALFRLPATLAVAINLLS